MATKKRFFTRNKKSVYKSPQDRTSIGNKSVNNREKKAQKVVQTVKKEKIEKRSSFKTPQLPNISQTITEVHGKIKSSVKGDFTWQKVSLWLFLTLVVGISLWQGFFLFQKTVELQRIVSQRSLLQQDLGLWQGITQKYPTYRDAYFQASILAYRLGDTTKEQVFLGKTLQLDPNYLPAQNLEKISH